MAHEEHVDVNRYHPAMAVDAVEEQSDAAMGVIRRGTCGRGDRRALPLWLGRGRWSSPRQRPRPVRRHRSQAHGEEKARIVEGLLPISGRKTRPPTWRPIEVTIVAQPEVRPWRYPPRMELQYGEWLRDALLSGAVEPEPAENPDLAVLITMVRQTGRRSSGRRRPTFSTLFRGPTSCAPCSMACHP